MTRHTSSEFEEELETLRERLLNMGRKAESAIAGALKALVARNEVAAKEIITADDEIDRDEIEIDQLAETMLATRQPVASDLRFIVMSMKIVTDLERIGDLAANIAKRAIELSRVPQTSPDADLAELGTRVQNNLHLALDSFVERDAEKATQVIQADAEIDRINAQIFSDLLARLAAETASLTRVIPLTSVSRSLERIGDHAKNLAEGVVYMVRGRDIRHGGAMRGRN